MEECVWFRGCRILQLRVAALGNLPSKVPVPRQQLPGRNLALRPEKQSCDEATFTPPSRRAAASGLLDRLAMSRTLLFIPFNKKLNPILTPRIR